MKGDMMKHMEKSAQLDRHGKMPDLTDMLCMRSNQEAYRFYWMVFGPHVYGKDSYRKDVFAPFMSEELARKVFTESDEAWGLLILEDNWELWWDMAEKDYKNYLRDRNIEVGGSSSEEDTSVDSSGNPLSEEQDVMSPGGTIDRRKIARKMVLTQLYSSKRTLGLSQLGFDRLEVLEELVHDDREKKGKDFYDYMKLSYIRDQGGIKMGQRGVKPVEKNRVLRMM
jgi:hypothetical protein